MKNKIYTFKLDHKLDEELKEFQDRLGEVERISKITANNGILVIVTEDESKKNLLLEDLKKNQNTTI